jgi:hypothetical protein
VEIVGYLIPTRGIASPLIKYDHKRLSTVCMCVHRAMPWLTRLVTGSHYWGLGSRPGQSLWDLWRTKRHRERLFSEFFSSPLSISFHCGSPYSHIIWGMNNGPDGGHSSEIQSHSIDRTTCVCAYTLISWHIFVAYNNYYFSWQNIFPLTR